MRLQVLRDSRTKIFKKAVEKTGILEKNMKKVFLPHWKGFMEASQDETEQ